MLANYSFDALHTYNLHLLDKKCIEYSSHLGSILKEAKCLSNIRFFFSSFWQRFYCLPNRIQQLNSISTIEISHLRVRIQFSILQFGIHGSSLIWHIILLYIRCKFLSFVMQTTDSVQISFFVLIIELFSIKIVMISMIFMNEKKDVPSLYFDNDFSLYFSWMMRENEIK